MGAVWHWVVGGKGHEVVTPRDGGRAQQKKFARASIPPVLIMSKFLLHLNENTAKG